MKLTQTDLLIRLMAMLALGIRCYGAISIPDALAQADAVVVGQVSSRTESSKQVSFNIAVDRVIKGPVTVSVYPVSHQWSRRILMIGPDDQLTLKVPIYGVWALIRNGSATWDVISANGPDGLMPSLFYPAEKSTPGHLGEEAGLKPEEQFAYEIESALEAGAGSALEFASAIGQLQTPFVDKLVVRLLDVPNALANSAGLLIQLQQSSSAAPASLLALWPRLRTTPLSSTIKSVLRDSFRTQDPNAVSVIIAIADSQDARLSDLRPAAIGAIAAVHIPAALPFLASLLSSSDESERIEGVSGLSSYANNCVPQTPAGMPSLAHLQIPHSGPYQTPETIMNFSTGGRSADVEQKLIDFWGAWWKQHPELAQP